MIIRWDYFIIVFVTSLVAAGMIVTLFSLALRLRDGETRGRRILSVVMYIACGLLVVVGIILIVPALRSAVFSM